MQKFKTRPSQVIKAYKEILDSKMDSKLFYELEGELLESGTVEKCSTCCSTDCNKKVCCHNKKEEKPLHGHALGISCVPDCFNRETPKLPEKLIGLDIVDTALKVNELIDYLKAHE